MAAIPSTQTAVNDEVIDSHRFRHLLSSIRHCSLQQVRAFFESESLSLSHAQRLVNISFPGEDTALTCACRRDNLEIVRYFLQLGADPNLPNSAHDLPLLIACHQGYDSIAEVLLEYGASLPESKDPDKMPIHFFYNDRILQLLVDMGMSVHVHIPNTLQSVTMSYLQVWNEVTYPASNLLFQHLPSGNVRGLSLLLNHGAEVVVAEKLFTRHSSNNRDSGDSFHLQDQSVIARERDDCYLYSLLSNACEYSLEHVVGVCLIRDDGMRPILADHGKGTETSSVKASPPPQSPQPSQQRQHPQTTNIFLNCLFRTTHPTILLLLLGFPVMETIDVMSRYFGDLPPRQSQRFTAKGRRQRKKHTEESGWTDSMLLSILRELAPDELLIDIRQLVNDKGNNLLMNLLESRLSVASARLEHHYHFQYYLRTSKRLDFIQYRHYLFAVILLLSFGVDIHHQNHQGETAVEIFHRSCTHPSAASNFHTYYVQGAYLVTLEEPGVAVHRPNPGMASPPRARGNESTLMEASTHSVARWCKSLVYSLDTPPVLLEIVHGLASSVSSFNVDASMSSLDHDDPVAVKCKSEWCSAHWPKNLLLQCPAIQQLLLSTLSSVDDHPSASHAQIEINEMSSTVPSETVVRRAEVNVHPTWSLVLMETLLFHFLHHVRTHSSPSPSSNKGSKWIINGNTGRWWNNMNRQWWLYTSSHKKEN